MCAYACMCVCMCAYVCICVCEPVIVVQVGLRVPTPGLHTGFFSGGRNFFYSYLGQLQLKDLSAIWNSLKPVTQQYHWPNPWSAHKNCHWGSWAFGCKLWWSSRDFQTKKNRRIVLSFTFFFNNKRILLRVMYHLKLKIQISWGEGKFQGPHSSVWSPAHHLLWGKVCSPASS